MGQVLCCNCEETKHLPNTVEAASGRWWWWRWNCSKSRAFSHHVSLDNPASAPQRTQRSKLQRILARDTGFWPDQRHHASWPENSDDRRVAARSDGILDAPGRAGRRNNQLEDVGHDNRKPTTRVVASILVGTCLWVYRESSDALKEPVEVAGQWIWL